MRNRSLQSASSGTPWLCKQHKWTKTLTVVIPNGLQVSLPNSSSVYCSEVCNTELHKGVCNVQFYSQWFCRHFLKVPMFVWPTELNHAHSKPSWTILLSGVAAKFSGNHLHTSKSLTFFITLIPPSKKSLLLKCF